MGAKYDAIVIGAGHNGLVTACYLARARRKVLVLERRHVVGGACVTEEVWPGFKVSTAAYVNSLFRPEIIRDLRLKDYGYEALERNPSSFSPRPSPRRSARSSSTMAILDVISPAPAGVVQAGQAKARFQGLQQREMRIETMAGMALSVFAVADDQQPRRIDSVAREVNRKSLAGRRLHDLPSSGDRRQRSHYRELGLGDQLPGVQGHCGTGGAD